MKHFDLPFTERMVGVAGRRPNDLHRGYSQNSLVPCLHLENEFQIWDTLAIAEFLARSFPAKHLWPADRLAQARPFGQCGNALGIWQLAQRDGYEHQDAFAGCASVC